ncbi:MAG: LapA family protein [Pseudomonadota bacterium]
MIRYFRLFLLLVIAVAMIFIAIANREFVTVELVPTQFAAVAQYSLDVPLFVLMVGMALGGFILGWSWEYVREWRLRSESKQRKRQVERLENEMDTLKKRTGTEEDDVLALLK